MSTEGRQSDWLIIGAYTAILLADLYMLGFLQAWWYRLRLWYARRRHTVNYDRLELERRKYEAGYYQDDARAADAE